jgi:hypothetical protein
MAPPLRKVFQSRGHMNQHSGVSAQDTVQKSFMLTKQNRAILVVPVQFLKELGWEQGDTVFTALVSPGEIQISPEEVTLDRGRRLVFQGGSLALIYPERMIAGMRIDPEGRVNMWVEDGRLHVSGHQDLQPARKGALAAVEGVIREAGEADDPNEGIPIRLKPREAWAIILALEEFIDHDYHAWDDAMGIDPNDADEAPYGDDRGYSDLVHKLERIKNLDPRINPPKPPQLDRDFGRTDEVWTRDDDPSGKGKEIYITPNEAAAIRDSIDFVLDKDDDYDFYTKYFGGQPEDPEQNVQSYDLEGLRDLQGKLRWLAQDFDNLGVPSEDDIGFGGNKKGTPFDPGFGRED